MLWHLSAGIKISTLCADVHGTDFRMDDSRFFSDIQNYVASLLHWTADLDHVSTVKEIMCLNENGSLRLRHQTSPDKAEALVCKGIRKVVAFWLVSWPSDASVGMMFTSSTSLLTKLLCIVLISRLYRSAKIKSTRYCASSGNLPSSNASINRMFMDQWLYRRHNH
ncbi:hypothetical protein OUZ56_019052 [Daphnia magna]|uniref:Uncharacterized protein n=1 Tax=Daphnia magna TaxID=35525 RepID=A0ABQ9ZB72_9CRUS|nr:hypothetical protein OUZ56_019052 [Daphnia magna]